MFLILELFERRMNMKIFITGFVAAGKTTFGNKISKKLGIPIYHLDRIRHHKDWKKKIPTVVNREIRQILERKSWIIEGGAKSEDFMTDIQDQADKIIIFDLPFHNCFLNFFKRNRQDYGKPRQDLPEGHVQRLYLGSILWIFRDRFPDKYLRMRRIMNHHKNKTILVKDWKDADIILRNFDF